MSTCISRHGEFGEHTLDGSHTCTLCHVLDEEALRAELERLRAALGRAEGLVEAARGWREGLPVDAAQWAVEGDRRLAAAVDRYSAEDSTQEEVCPRCGGREGTHTIRGCSGAKHKMPVCADCGHRHRWGGECADHTWGDSCPYEAGADCEAGQKASGALPSGSDEPITFLVVAPQFAGSLEDWSVDYSRHLPDRFTDRAQAARDGEVELGHDDFCIATLRSGKLFAYGPKGQDFAPEDRDSLTHIARCLALEVHPEAIDGGDS